MHAVATRLCPGCVTSRSLGRSACVWCGCAIAQGRDPSPREMHETSAAALDERTEEIVQARRSADDIDRAVVAALRTHLSPTAEFTHDYLVSFTGLNPCALKYALRRLQERGVVKVVGQQWIRANRAREVWQYLLPMLAVVEAGTAAAAPIRRRRTAARR